MNPARFAVCQTKSDRSTVRRRMARACLVDRNMWMVDAHGQHQAAKQRGGDVVHVERAAGHRFALHREFQQLEAGAGLGQQRIRGHDGSHRGSGRSTEARAERNAFLDLHREAEWQAQCFLHGEQRLTCRVAGRLGRQITRDSMYAGDHHSRLVAPGDGYAIAQGVHRESQDVESDCNIANRGRRECGRALQPRRGCCRGSIQSRAPR